MNGITNRLDQIHSEYTAIEMKTSQMNILTTGLLIALLLFPSAARADDAPVMFLLRQEPPRDAPPETGGWGENHLPTQQAQPKAQTLHVDAGAAQDTRVVFQTYRNSNWEIYRADGAGNNVVRLTNHSAADIEPKLSFNGTKIVFTSKRDGNFEIYSMNADGSGLRRLTAHASDDYEPAWSPDGMQIVFVSERTGNAEIYKMNADGANLTRLTVSRLPNFRPAWSFRDKIVWLRFMDEGLGSRRELVWFDAKTNQPLGVYDCRWGGHPAWSPDGSKLAVDCDVDGDNWNEIIVSGNIYQTVHDPGQNLVDAVVGSWAPDSQAIQFTKVEYVVQSNQLRIRGLTLQRLSLTDGALTSLPNQTNTENASDWKWADVAAPTSSLQINKQYIKPDIVNSSFLVKGPILWSKNDVGPAPIAYFDLQYSSDGITWIDYEPPYTEAVYSDTVSVFVGAIGLGLQFKTLYFRTRGRDFAGNIEPWEQTKPVSTTVYMNRLFGTITDNRDNELPGASISILPQPHTFRSLATSGAFEAFNQDSNPNATFNLAVSKQGYADVMPTFRSPGRLLYADMVFSPYMAGIDNIVQSGTFDSPAGCTSEGWLFTPSPIPLNTFYASSVSEFTGACGFTMNPTSDPIITMSQQITIPALMINPTLKLAYQLRDPAFYPSVPGKFRVAVDDGVQPTTLLSKETTYTSPIVSNIPWVTAWVDMQPWSGKTITLSLSLSKIQTTPTVNIDDITLTSWLTPLPTKASVDFAEVDNHPLTVTLTGTNFLLTPTIRIHNTTIESVQWVSSTLITAQIPANLAPGIYDVWVVNPGGQANVLSNAVKIGKQTYLPIITNAP